MAYASAVELTVQPIIRAGKAVSEDLVAATATHGNKFLNNGQTFLRVLNGSASPITVTLQCPKTVDGLAVVNPTVTVAATGDSSGLDYQDIGPFPLDWNQADGPYMWVTFSAVTTVTVGAYRL